MHEMSYVSERGQELLVMWTVSGVLPVSQVCSSPVSQYSEECSRRCGEC